MRTSANVVEDASILVPIIFCHIPWWSRYGAPYHVLHFVKHNIECRQLDMSQVHIENQLFIEHVNNTEGLKKAEGQRIGRV